MKISFVFKHWKKIYRAFLATWERWAEKGTGKHDKILFIWG